MDHLKAHHKLVYQIISVSIMFLIVLTFIETFIALLHGWHSTPTWVLGFLSSLLGLYVFLADNIREISIYFNYDEQKNKLVIQAVNESKKGTAIMFDGIVISSINPGYDYQNEVWKHTCENYNCEKNYIGEFLLTGNHNYWYELKPYGLSETLEFSYENFLHKLYNSSSENMKKKYKIGKNIFLIIGFHDLESNNYYYTSSINITDTVLTLLTND